MQRCVSSRGKFVLVMIHFECNHNITGGYPITIYMVGRSSQVCQRSGLFEIQNCVTSWFWTFVYDSLGVVSMSWWMQSESAQGESKI